MDNAPCFGLPHKDNFNKIYSGIFQSFAVTLANQHVLYKVLACTWIKIEETLIQI